MDDRGPVMHALMRLTQESTPVPKPTPAAIEVVEDEPEPEPEPAATHIPDADTPAGDSKGDTTRHQRTRTST